jgi:hypothetical protein
MGDNMVEPEMVAARATIDAVELDVPVVADASVCCPWAR